MRNPNRHRPDRRLLAGRGTTGPSGGLVVFLCLLSAFTAPASATPAQSPEAQLAQIRELVQQGNLPAADRAVVAFVQAHPAEPAGWHIAGLVSASLGRSEEAIAAYRRAIELEPAGAESWNNLGDLLRRAGDLSASLHALETALELSPDYPQAQLNLGLVHIQLRNFEEASNALERARRGLGDQPLILYSQALVSLESGDFEAAGRLVRAFREASKGWAGFSELSARLIEKARFAEALELLESIPEDIRTPEIRLGLGQAWLGLEHTQEAHSLFADLVRRFPEDPRARLWLSHAARNLGDRTKARDGFASVLELDPYAIEAIVALADLKLEDGLPTEALTLIERGLSMLTENPRLKVQKATALIRLERGREAVPLLESISPSAAEFRQALYLLARTLRELGETVRAEQAWTRFREVDLERGRTLTGTPGRIRP